MMLQPGDRIGPYEVRGLLGAGGMGEVYRAHDVRLGRDVALKTLPAAFVADGERLARFEREARVLAALNHPHIATIHGIERQDDILALVMELVEGDTLDERLLFRSQPGTGLALPEALRIARQIIAALDAAHEKGIIHRDLKPANIKLTADDEVKVLDFGLAKAVDTDGSPPSGMTSTALSPAQTRVGTVVGTAAYMSPEQARGQAVDKRTDIWAFGCIVYELATGRPAFAGDSLADTMAAVLGAQVDMTAVPGQLRRLVERCLERNPKARLRDIGDARLLLDDEPATMTPAPTGGISRRAVITGGIALALAGAAGGAFLSRRTASRATPFYHRLTFRRGMIRSARFGPDFQTVYYGALWDGDVCRVYSVRPESPESAALPLPPATPLAVSASGELALALGTHLRGIMTYGTLAQVPMAGGAPRELQELVKYADWATNGRDLAIVRQVGDRDQLEFPRGNVIAHATEPGGGFSFPRVSPRGDSVAVFELPARTLLNGRVVIIDRSGATRAASTRYFNVFGLAWRGDEVWFTAADELPLFRNAIHAMTASGSVRVIARVPGNASLHDIAPDGRALIARTDDRSGIAVRVPGDTRERDLSWLDAPFLADLAPDGSRILFTESGVGGGPRRTAYLRGTDGSAAVRLGDGQARALSHDGRWAIVYTGGTHLDVVPTGAGQSRRLERPGLTLGRVRWLRDGQHVVVHARAGSGIQRLYVLELEGDGVRPLTPESLSVPAAAWAVSPDGAAVAVSTDQGVHLFPIATGPSRPVPGLAGTWVVVGWIEAGLLVSKDPAAEGVVLRVNPATGQREAWTNIQPQDPGGIMNLDLGNLVVTPDGRGYGYTWHRATSDLYLVDGLA